ncbi:MAG: antitoxin Xre/MbcA/ParS toxin-binding domain-containing protein [Acidimicrobiales bacterium]
MAKEVASAQPAATRAFEGSTYRDVVVRARRAMSTEELAKVVGVQPRQVGHWVAGAHRPQGQARQRLLDLGYVVEVLGDVYDDEGVQIWLHGRNRSLGGRRPLELLVEGDFSTVLAAAERLASGAM